MPPLSLSMSPELYFIPFLLHPIRLPILLSACYFLVRACFLSNVCMEERLFLPSNLSAAIHRRLEVFLNNRSPPPFSRHTSINLPVAQDSVFSVTNRTLCCQFTSYCETPRSSTSFVTPNMVPGKRDLYVLPEIISSMSHLGLIIKAHPPK